MKRLLFVVALVLLWQPAEAGVGKVVAKAVGKAGIQAAHGTVGTGRLVVKGLKALW